MRAAVVSVLAGITAVGGCTRYETEYERQVADYEPIYCYRSLGDATCYRQPRHRDGRQLVNYYGEPPRTYDRPDPPKPMNLDAPPRVKKYYRDPEPDAGPPSSSSDAANQPPAGPAAKKPTEASEGPSTLSTIVTYLPLVIGAAQIVAAFVF